jgi:2,4-dienoyl-CoA reductase-like NADH-dependent reductase (Old Yellow Enzyme family)
LTKDKRAQQIQNAIAHHDAAALRRLATAAHREEARMWLQLLARMVELDGARRRRRPSGGVRLVVSPPARRTSIRRAV